MATNRTKEEIAESTGTGLIIGFLGGSAYHFIKELKSATNGIKFINATEVMSTNGFRVGGEVAVYFGMMTALEKAIGNLRNKEEDPWNRILAATATAGLLNIRGGVASASGTALIAGALVGLAEVAKISITNVMEERARIK